MLTLAELVDEYLQVHQAEPVTLAKLRWLLAKAAAVLGEVRLAELSPEQVCAWRLAVPDGHRYGATQALRQVLNRAGRLGTSSTTTRPKGVPNPPRRYKKKRPFESWKELETVAERLGPLYGPMVVFAAATDLRPSELFALEQRDLDLGAGVVFVRGAFANGRVKHTKTRLSTRAVPLQSIALEALDRLPISPSPLLFPNSRGGDVDFRNFGPRHWKPAQIGIAPLRYPYDFALRADVSVFALSRFMGSSLAMIDLHYGHLASDSRQHARLAARRARDRARRGRWVDAARKAAKPLSNRGSRPLRKRSRHAVDVRWTSRPQTVANRGNVRS